MISQQYIHITLLEYHHDLTKMVQQQMMLATYFMMMSTLLLFITLDKFHIHISLCISICIALWTLYPHVSYKFKTNGIDNVWKFKKCYASCGENCAHVLLYIGLIKSNQSFWQLHFPPTYILVKYFIDSQTLNKMPQLYHTLKLISRHASFRFSGTKQWHTLWIRKSCLKRVTGSIIRVHITIHNPRLKCHGQA